MATEKTTKQETTTFHQVFVKALSEMPVVGKDGKNPFLNNKYATLDNIIAAVRPVLAKYGMAFYQMVDEHGVNTVVVHESGQQIESGFLPIPAESKSSLSMAQNMGAAITYMKRYQLGALLGISTDEDVDGHVATNGVSEHVPQPSRPAKPKMSHEQFHKALAKIEAGEVDTVEKSAMYFDLLPIQLQALQEAVDKLQTPNK